MERAMLGRTLLARRGIDPACSVISGSSGFASFLAGATDPNGPIDEPCACSLPACSREPTPGWQRRHCSERARRSLLSPAPTEDAGDAEESRMIPVRMLDSRLIVASAMLLAGGACFGGRSAPRSDAPAVVAAPPANAGPTAPSSTASTPSSTTESTTGSPAAPRRRYPFEGADLSPKAPIQPLSPSD